MGFLISKILEFFTKNRNNFKIIILGLQEAGKTTILYRLSLGQFVKTSPTIGSNVEELTYNNVKFQAWDLGGQESIRALWDVYYVNTDAVIYVIDSKDDENFEISKSEFYKVLANKNLKNSVILIFANKQDLPGAKNINKIVEDYELSKIKDHIWHIIPCSAVNGEGLVNGIKWLSDQLVFRGKNNFPNNPYTMEDEEKDNNKNQNSQTDNSNINLNISNTNNDNNNNIVGEINNIEEKKNNESNINNIDTTTQK